MLCVARATGMHTRVILTCKQEIIGAMFALYCGLFVIFRVPAEYRGGGIQAGFDFVVGVTNFRGGSSLHCETYLRVTIIRQRYCYLF